MREVIAANVGLASRRRVKRKDDSARKNGAPPNGRGESGVGFTGSEDGRGPMVGEDPGERRPRGEPAEGRAPMKGSSADGGVEHGPKIGAGVGACACARASAHVRMIGRAGVRRCVLLEKRMSSWCARRLRRVRRRLSKVAGSKRASEYWRRPQLMSHRMAQHQGAGCPGGRGPGQVASQNSES